MFKRLKILLKSMDDNKQPERKLHGYDTLVISGGAIKGLLLLGSIQCAMDNLLLKDVVNFVGTSAGSMISYLLAIGYTPVEIIVYICTHQLLERMASFNLVAMLNGEGAVSYQPIQEALEKMSIDKIGYFPTLRELREKYNKNLVCATYNKTRHKMEYLSADNYPDLPCLVAVRMSSNVPMLFERFKYMGFEYVDGGVGDNFPIMEAEKIGQRVLGVVLIPNLKEDIDTDGEQGFLQDTLKLLYVPISQAVIYRISLITEKSTCVQIDSDKIKVFDFNLKSSQKLNMFSTGYQQFKKYLDNNS